MIVTGATLHCGAFPDSLEALACLTHRRRMTPFVRLFTAVTLIVALLTGAVAGALAAEHGGHMASAAGHSGFHHAALAGAPAHGEAASHHNKAGPAVVAPCCPAAEAPGSLLPAVRLSMESALWQPGRAWAPDARAISPEPRPPKILL